jgi:23S rRNA (uracil1939-C5)-methyltransferase
LQNKSIIKKGAELELKIESLAFGGTGVSHHEGAVIFVKNAIPGQTVMARVYKKRSSYFEARTLVVLQESVSHSKEKCEHFADCGGCTFQNLEYDVQLLEKEQQVKDIFRRIGGFPDVKIEPILGCNEVFNYRNKMEFTFSNRRWLISDVEDNLPKDFALGLHIAGRYDKILNINECHIQNETANGILALVKQMVMDLEIQPYDLSIHKGFIRNLIIRVGQNTDEIMVILVTSRNDTKQLEPIVNALIEKFPTIASIMNNINSRKAGVTYGEQQVVLYGKDHIVEKLGQYSFEISPDSFFQTNSRQAERLYDVIKAECALTGEEIVYDLFCGTGSISLYISEMAKEVYGFELVSSAVQDAMQNAVNNGVTNATFLRGDLMDLFRESQETNTFPNPDVMVLDPPRVGLHPKTIPDILEKSPKRIIYVSCNPSTQARDIKELCANGYELIKLRPVDMFPHTPHVENVATLVKIDTD